MGHYSKQQSNKSNNLSQTGRGLTISPPKKATGAQHTHKRKYSIRTNSSKNKALAEFNHRESRHLESSLLTNITPIFGNNWFESLTVARQDQLPTSFLDSTDTSIYIFYTIRTTQVTFLRLKLSDDELIFGINTKLKINIWVMLSFSLHCDT